MVRSEYHRPHDRRPLDHPPLDASLIKPICGAMVHESHYKLDTFHGADLIS